MKTALVKTDIVDDDIFYEMNIDTKLLYMIILMSPERGVGRVYKLGDRLLSFRTGLNSKQLEVCKEQLQQSQLVFFYDGYVYLGTKSSFVQPVKGKLTYITLQKEINSIPKDIYTNFKRVYEEILGNGSQENDLWLSGESPVHVNVNDNVSVNVPVNDVVYEPKKAVIQKEAQDLAATMRDSVKTNFNFIKKPLTEKDVGKWAADIEKIHTKDGYDWNIISATLQWALNDDFWKQNIRSGSKFRKQFERLLISAKADYDKGRKYGAEVMG